MLIDLVDPDGNLILRYESDIMPDTGHSITVRDDDEYNEYIVEHVDHLLKKSPVTDYFYEQLATLTVTIVNK